MDRLLKLFFVLLFLSSFTACDPGLSSTKSVQNPDESEVPEETFSIGLENSGTNLMIKKSQLGEEYVFLPTLVEFTSPVTTTDVYATKLVYFERVEDHLYLMEQMEGRTITDPYEPVSILAQFPIVAEDEFTITFDFKSGFDALIMNWGDYDDTDLPDSSVPITASYLENFVVEKKRFSFDHVAQISLPSFFEDVLRTVRFNYAFIPSKRDAISWLIPDEEERFGYFLTRPTYERGSGEAFQVVHHWDISKPILFYVSANTPAEYYPAVAGSQCLAGGDEIPGPQG